MNSTVSSWHRSRLWHGHRRRGGRRRAAAAPREVGAAARLLLLLQAAAGQAREQQHGGERWRKRRKRRDSKKRKKRVKQDALWVSPVFFLSFFLIFLLSSFRIPLCVYYGRRSDDRVVALAGASVARAGVCSRCFVCSPGLSQSYSFFVDVIVGKIVVVDDSLACSIFSFPLLLFPFFLFFLPLARRSTFDGAAGEDGRGQR